MSIKFYTDLVSPFVQTKVFYHHNALEEVLNKKIVTPITCEIDLTDGFCNNKCKHCFFGTDKKATPIYADTNIIKELLCELSNSGTKGIEFSGGGEPTTHPNIAEIIEFALSKGLQVGLVTNGLLLHKVKHLIDKLTFLRISLDAGSANTYKIVHGVDTFDQVIKNVREIISSSDSDKLGIGFLIVPDNVGDIFDAALLALELGVRFIQYRPASLPYRVDEKVWITAANEVKKVVTFIDKEQLQVFDAGIKWYHVSNERKYSRCFTSSIVAVVKANGDIPLCVLKRNDPKFIIGNIKDGGFLKHWFSAKHFELIDQIILSKCRKPCKHDSYNIVCESLQSDLNHKNFI